LKRSVGLGPCPMEIRLRDELFNIAHNGNEEQMRKFLQNPQVNVNHTRLLRRAALHETAGFNPDIGVTKVQSSMQKTKAR
jgi:hypothetical protein